MQPFLLITCPVAGFIYVNGRFAATASDEAVCVPVSPTGAAYLEFRPSVPGFAPMARSLCLSRGGVVGASVSPERGLSVIAWPGGAVEAALEPEPLKGYGEEVPEAGVTLDGGTRQTVTPLGDVAGHALVETYVMRAGQWTLVESEVMWDASGPRWPRDAEETALAAAQAAILGQAGEAAGYVAPGKAFLERSLAELRGNYDGCARAVYQTSGDVVALVKVVSPNLARIDLARYSCARLGGRQGEWKLEAFEICREREN